MVPDRAVDLEVEDAPDLDLDLANGARLVDLALEVVDDPAAAQTRNHEADPDPINEDLSRQRNHDHAPDLRNDAPDRDLKIFSVSFQLSLGSTGAIFRQF